MNCLSNKSVYILSGLLAIALPLAEAQVGPVRGGQALDRNLRIGSGGLNAPTRQYVPNRANLSISGNVTGGQAFRGFSPIRDSSELFTTLPSSILSNFWRDSISAGEVRSGSRGGRYLPYFSREQSVTNTGAIGLGLNAPGSSIPVTRNLVPRARSNYLGPGNAVSGIPTRITPQPLDLRSSVNLPLEVYPLEDRRRLSPGSRLDASPLFRRIAGLESRLRTHETLAEQQARSAASIPGVDRAARLPNELVSPTEPLAHAGNQLPAGASLLDRRVQGRVEGQVTMDPVEGNRRVVRPLGMEEPVTDQGAGVPFAGESSLAESSVGLAQPLHRPLYGRVLPEAARRGGDVFLEMRLAVESVSSSLAPRDHTSGSPPAGRSIAEVLRAFEEEDARKTAERNPGLDPDLDIKIDPFRKFLAAPVRTFVGTERSTVNTYLARAEATMREGVYYRAKTLYEIAATIDPESPLPILGKAHASLAAGEYMTAARQIRQAIEVFPQIAWFRIDLRALVAREDTLDIRRADLERLLESNENADLRFLLGYVEYCSGFESFGLKNLSRAAEALGPSSAGSLFVKMLEEARQSPISPPPSNSAPGTKKPAPAGDASEGRQP